jgi:membrane fusion protein, multidrug efflux system
MSRFIKNFIHLIYITTGGILVISSCSGGPAGGGFSMPPTPVETVLVTPQTVTDKFEAVGTIEAEKEITVVSEIDASVKRIPFKEGQKIKEGDLIVQLDASQLAAELKRAEALRDQSQSNYDRIKAVVDQNAGSMQDLDDAAAALKVAEANLMLARARYAKTQITAPFNGIIGARRISPGAFVRSGQTLTDLAQIEELRVNFSAPERYLSKLNEGAEVTVSTTAYPGYTLTGKIKVIEPVIDPVTRSARIIAEVSNPQQKFRPGMSANISAVLSERNDALTIPNEAVFVTGDQSFVYVVNADSTVSKTALTLGTRLADVVEVLQGLKDGMTIVRAGHQKLYEGAHVQPVSANASNNDSKTTEKF